MEIVVAILALPTVMVQTLYTVNHNIQTLQKWQTFVEQFSFKMIYGQHRASAHQNLGTQESW
jgi:hypothetical protein